MNRYLGILVDQFRLLVVSCRVLHGMTIKRLLGQGWRDGKTAFDGEPPGFSIGASY
ncbi:MAG: hypothetical protein M0Q01_09845 [Syntrophales bacterium]|nr:hypothetical protein [Syntrophales bacterium]